MWFGVPFWRPSSLRRFLNLLSDAALLGETSLRTRRASRRSLLFANASVAGSCP